MMTDQRETADRVGGLGFEKNLTINKKLIELQRGVDKSRRKAQGEGDDSEVEGYSVDKLKGIGIEDVKYLD